MLEDVKDIHPSRRRLPTVPFLKQYSNPATKQSLISSTTTELIFYYAVVY
jgi:hypothetical protein